MDGRKPIAEIDVSWWREKGVLTIEGANYAVYRESLLGGAFILEDRGKVLARAEKLSVLSRRLVIECEGLQYTLNPRRFFRRTFELADDTGVVGTLSPRGLLSRRMRVDLSDKLPLPVRIFVVWLAVILWKRDSDAAG